MVGRAVYDHPLRWAAVDAVIHGITSQHPGETSWPWRRRWCGA
jgi:hypothetical protein